MVINHHKKIFVGQRIDNKGEAWQMPQGGINENETITEAGLRELYEETNIHSDFVTIIAKSENWLYYDIPEFLIDKLWNGKYRGQAQRWLLLYFHGPESAIDIDTPYPEFKKWKWLGIEQLKNVVVPFKKHLYCSVVAEFKPLIDSFQPSRL